MNSKFVSKTILTSKDGLQYEEVQREQPIKIDEKKIRFMTLSEQLVEQEKIDSALRPEVTKMQRKKQTKPNIYEKTKPLSDEDRDKEYVEESGFKQEIFNEEDFDYFQYYGHLREIEDKKLKLEREHVRIFKARRNELVIDNTPQIVVYKDQAVQKPINVIRFKKPFLEDLIIEPNTEIPQKKVKLVAYDSD